MSIIEVKGKNFIIWEKNSNWWLSIVEVKGKVVGLAEENVRLAGKVKEQKS